MIVRNLTDETLNLRARSIYDFREFEMHLVARGSFDTEGIEILNVESLMSEGKLSTDLCTCHASVEEESTPVVEESQIEEEATVEEIQEEEETPEEVEETQEEDEDHEVVEETSDQSDKFICELCGSEFASARGLNSHMNRVHSNKEG